MGRLSVFVIVFACLMTAGVAMSEVPMQLTHQGEVILSDSSRLTGVETVIFSIYSSDDTLKWSEELDITFDDGYYTVVLGEENPFTEDIFDGNILYLGVQVGSADEMSPRIKIVSVPYAIIAGGVYGKVNATEGIFVDGRSVINSDGQWVGDFSNEGETSIRVSATGVECGNDTGAGGLRWNDTNGQLETCNGTDWETVCAGSGDSYIPRITSISPNPVNPSEDTTITIHGQAFEEGCVVEINDEERTVTYITSDIINSNPLQAELQE